MRDVTNAVDPKNENANDDLRIFQRETYPSDYPSTEFICACLVIYSIKFKYMFGCLYETLRDEKDRCLFCSDFIIDIIQCC